MPQFNRFRKVAFVCLFLWSSASRAAPRPFELPVMKAESSHWTETGRAEESERLCLALVRAYPKKVRCESFGISPEGRNLRVLVVSGSGALTPAAARKKSLPVVWIQAGIHAGEIEGKDATYAYLKDELAKKESPLSKQVLLFCPVINIDGHERFGKWNRANQNGPVEKGWRVNSQNLNLNRDYAKLDTPEVAQSLKYLEKWNPHVWVDLHTTDGAKFQHDVAVMIPSTLTGTGKLLALSTSLQERLMSELTHQGHLPLWYYPEFLKTDDPLSGIENLPDSPKMGYTYFAYRGRVGILVETHSWRSYEERAKSTRHVIETLLTDVALRGPQYVDSAREQDQMKQVGRSQTLGYQVKGAPETVDFLG
ncbi:MAG: peptidase M14, partial [Proteobacteria bacterium]